MKNHFPEPEQLTSKWQLAEENYALLIGLSKYTVLQDKEYANLPAARNDAQAIRDFLLQSPCKFKEENIIMLLDPTFEQIK